MVMFYCGKSREFFHSHNKNESCYFLNQFFDNFAVLFSRIKQKTSKTRVCHNHYEKNLLRHWLGITYELGGIVPSHQPYESPTSGRNVLATERLCSPKRPFRQHTCRHHRADRIFTPIHFQ
jgi:hypothetical protein